MFFTFCEVGVRRHDVRSCQLSPLFQKVQISVLRLCRMAAVPCAFRDIHDLFAGQIERLVVYVTVELPRVGGAHGAVRRARAVMWTM